MSIRKIAVAAAAVAAQTVLAWLTALIVFQLGSLIF